MARLIGFRGLLCTTIAVVWAFSGRASPAQTLRLVTAEFNDKTSGFNVELLRQVLGGMGQQASFETFPARRSWMMMARGESDGIFGVIRTSERERICSFPDEPLVQDRYVFFVRTADVGKLKFSSLDDLVGHGVAVQGTVPGVLEQPLVSPELWKFLREHDNMIETSGTLESFRMLAAGRVDYAVASARLGIADVITMGLSGKIEPLLSRSVFESGVYVCFSKARVSRSWVDAFSQALEQFKQTEAYQAIYRKYHQ
jgi:polar amino acid transport system substrate-binding protein